MQHCWTCHGGPAQEAGLDLRTQASILKGGRSGAAVIPGQPEESRLIQRIRDAQCPPSRRLVEANVKPVPDTALEKLRRWIADGAPEEPAAAAAVAGDPGIKPGDREFWSFRPPAKVVPPAGPNGGGARHPVDAFILEKLRAQGLGLAPEASKTVLLRRVSFDLTGLPPTPEEVARFAKDLAPDAYERLVDRLLASPHYGERWARYWMDVAGYADVEGKREQHLPRPHNYRYRDYVIRAFNDDKPYDRFLLEQIAGDELADYESAPEITPELYDNLVATAFLRQAPDPTWANITGFLPDRLDVIADAMDVLGSGVMGLTMKCSRCHDHKFDPLLQRDYYRLTDVFKGVLDEYDWLKPGLQPYGGAGNSGPLKERTLPQVTTVERRAWEKECDRLKAEVERETRALAAEEEQVRARYLEVELGKLPAGERDAARRLQADPVVAAGTLESGLRERLEKLLKPNRDRLKEWDGDFKRRCDAVASMPSRRPPEPRVAALWDRGRPSPTYVYLRGDFQRPGARVVAGVPAVFSRPDRPWVVSPPWPGSTKTGRRLAFARWLTEPDHPLTSRVMVNRVWKHHFGRGIVRTLDNFGRMGAAPTHPELLDWLAGQLVGGGWRLKPLQRLIVTSATYRQASRASEEALRGDPDNTLISRMPLQRLDAEALWDSLITVAGVRDDTPFGPAQPVEVRRDGTVVPGRTGDRWRRSIYGQQTRKDIPTLMESFDLPPMNPNCVQRSESNVATQALNLLNDAVVRELAARFARRLVREGGRSVDGRITRAFQVALARNPAVDELAAARHLVDGRSGPEAGAGVGTPDVAPSVRELLALDTLCRMLMNSAEFLYVD